MAGLDMFCTCRIRPTFVRHWYDNLCYYRIILRKGPGSVAVPPFVVAVPGPELGTGAEDAGAEDGC